MKPLRKDQQMQLRQIMSVALICTPVAAGAGSLEELLLEAPTGGASPPGMHRQRYRSDPPGQASRSRPIV